MRACKFVALVFAAAVAPCAQPFTGTDQPGPLALPIFPTPIVRKRIPLTKALSEVGVEIRHGYVSFGIEARLKDGEEPSVDLSIQPGSTVGDALHQILRQLPEYRFEVVSDHLIGIYPAGAKEDPNDLLNLHVSRFDVVSEDPGALLSRPQDFIPELKGRLTPRRAGGPQPGGTGGDELRGVGPGITLHLRNVTVRDILNAVSEATEKFPPNLSPVGWVYSFQPDPNLPAGGVHSWMFHWSAPSNWKEEAEKGQKQTVQ